MAKRAESPQSRGFHRPFEHLSELLPRPAREPDPPAVTPDPPAPSPVADEADLFEHAMADVRPIDWNRPGEVAPPAVRPGCASEEQDELAQLRNLVEHGAGFDVSATPEYMEGVGRLAPPGITTRLHRGDFSVQGHVDLHGLTVDEARNVFERFMREAILAGKRTVLVIHGRGLSSPAAPVLKTKVAEWLGSNRWRKWVLAFTSARWCDGGSGATYVLLRRTPMAKRSRNGPTGKKD